MVVVVNVYTNDIHSVVILHNTYHSTICILLTTSCCLILSLLPEGAMVVAIGDVMGLELPPGPVVVSPPVVVPPPAVVVTPPVVVSLPAVVASWLVEAVDPVRAGILD